MAAAAGVGDGAGVISSAHDRDGERYLGDVRHRLRHRAEPRRQGSYGRRRR